MSKNKTDVKEHEEDFIHMSKRSAAAFACLFGIGLVNAALIGMMVKLDMQEYTTLNIFCIVVLACTITANIVIPMLIQGEYI